MHLANVWETIADTLPDAPALIGDGWRRSWAEYEDRAARFAGFLATLGIGRNDKVALYLNNCPEYLEAQFGVFKQRACSINVNYRYTAEELVYLLDNADAEVLVYHARFRDTVAAIRAALPGLATLVEVDEPDRDAPGDGPGLRYERLLAMARPAPRCQRGDDDLYMLYTGGTTGLPKGVMYDMDTVCNGLLRAYDVAGLERPTTPAALAVAVREVRDAGAAPIALPACPMMHGTGMWIGSMVPHNLGVAVVTFPDLGFDPARTLRIVAQARVTNLVIVGDAFARPLLTELDRAAAAGTPYDLGSLNAIASSGAMWSAEVKAGLLRHADLRLADLMGSTEGGMARADDSRESADETARFELVDGVTVLDDDDRPVAPGSGVAGRLAISGFVPRGYYKDPEKSAATFRDVDGVRYSFPGDYATVAADGAIHLLGRGSSCINSGGEKVYPEEVEETLKRHPGVLDCLVVGLPHDRFGQQVAAVVATAPGAGVRQEALLAEAREHLAGYKLPRRLLLTDRVARSPSGKPDYAWARQRLLAADPG